MDEYGLGERNARGDTWLDWCSRHNQVITNTWFKQHPKNLWTWKSPVDRVRNQIDYITINKRFRNAVTLARSYPGADCNSDHVPVVATFKLKLKILKKPGPKTMKLDYELLKDPLIKDKFQLEFENRFEALEIEQSNDIEEDYDRFKTTFMEAANCSIPAKKNTIKKGWMTDEILNMMEERRKHKRSENQYREIDKEIKRKCTEEKEKWLNTMCIEIESNRNTDSRKLHSKIKEIAGKRKNTCSSSGCLKAKDGTIIIEKEEIIKRWEEYIEELFYDERGIKPTRKDEDYGEDILKSEVEFALRKMKRGKAPGPDQVNVEMLDSAGEIGLEKLTELINKGYNTGNIPGDLLKSIFMAIPKKPKANECELHRTISLMSHTTKILLRILMKRARTQIKPEISDSQYGFVQGKGTRNAIYMMRTLIERSIEMKQDIYVCMIDYSKAWKF